MVVVVLLLEAHAAQEAVPLPAAAIGEFAVLLALPLAHLRALGALRVLLSAAGGRAGGREGDL